MQADSIVLAVDRLNNGTTTNETYARYDINQNRSTYIGSSHLAEARDTISMYRSFATKSGNFKGVQKTSVKFTKDHEVTGVDGTTTLTAPVILEISFSVPVGVTAAQMKIVRQRALALLDSDTVMDALNVQLMV